MNEVHGGGFGPRSEKLLRCPLYFLSPPWLLQPINSEDEMFSSCNLQDQIPAVTPVEVVGVVRGSEKPSIFVPENDPSSGQWFYVDVPSIARACELPENTIYVEDINENISSGCPYPVPKDVNTLIRSSVMPQDHLNYTLTWYASSVTLTSLFTHFSDCFDSILFLDLYTLSLSCIGFQRLERSLSSKWT